MYISAKEGRRGFISGLVDRFMTDSAPDAAIEITRNGQVVRLNSGQSEAVRKGADWLRSRRKRCEGNLFFYVEGPAGTGKSTLADALVAVARDEGRCRRIIGMAFTAKACQVLKSKTSLDEVMTVHRALYHWVRDSQTGKGRFEVNPNGPAASADLIVLDECGMINKAMGRQLMSLGVPVLALGDVYGQLAPITGDAFFADVEPDVYLSEVQRQARESGIVQLAEMLRNKQMPRVGVYGEGVVVLPLTKETQILLYRPETQPLCGVHRVRWTYSQRIRRQRGFSGARPMPGERVLWRKNLHDVGVFNGMLGRTVEAPTEQDDGTVRLSIDYDDLDQTITLPTHPYLFDQHFGGTTTAPELGRGVGAADWGYVLTCHSAQGSEWADVSVVDDSQSFGEQRWRWLYTAVTRSSRNLTLLVRQ